MTFLKKIESHLKVESATHGKVIRDFKLKNGVTIPKDTPAEVKWLPESESHGYLAQVVPQGFEPFKTKIRSIYQIVSGFPKPPSVATMEKWMNDGVAKTPTGQRTEPDGYGSDGSPSWLLAVGVI